MKIFKKFTLAVCLIVALTAVVGCKNSSSQMISSPQSDFEWEEEFSQSESQEEQFSEESESSQTSSSEEQTSQEGDSSWESSSESSAPTQEDSQDSDSYEEEVPSDSDDGFTSDEDGTDTENGTVIVPGEDNFDG